MSDTAALLQYDLNVPTGSWLTGDKAYNHYTVEDVLREAGVELLPIRKSNSHHPVPPFFTYLQASVRKMVGNHWQFAGATVAEIYSCSDRSWV